MKMITAILFVLVPFLKKAPHIIIHLAMNVEKGGGVLMRITLPNLVPVPDFRVFHTPYFFVSAFSKNFVQM